MFQNNYSFMKCKNLIFPKLTPKTHFVVTRPILSIVPFMNWKWTNLLTRLRFSSLICNPHCHITDSFFFWSKETSMYTLLFCWYLKFQNVHFYFKLWCCNFLLFSLSIIFSLFHHKIYLWTWGNKAFLFFAPSVWSIFWWCVYLVPNLYIGHIF